MPLNLLKTYPDFLELTGTIGNITNSLKGIYLRDIENNPDFKIRGITIHPLKSEDGELEMSRTFTHLTTHECVVYDDEGNPLPEKHREFDFQRSKRLHWINHHIHERNPENIKIFTITERDKKKRQDVTHTYIFDFVEKYVIILDRRASKDFYLLTAYYLDKPYAQKELKKKMKKSMGDII